MSELTVTIKQHAGYEASWLVLKGEPGALRNQLIEMCGEAGDDHADVSLVELVQRATAYFQHGKPITLGSPAHDKAVETAVNVLGGTVVSETTTATPKAATRAPEATAPAACPVTEAINAAGTKDALTDVFRAHRDAILASETLKAALKAANERIA